MNAYHAIMKYATFLPLPQLSLPAIPWFHCHFFQTMLSTKVEDNSRICRFLKLYLYYILIGSKIIWDIQIYEVKTLNCTAFWWFYPQSSCKNFEPHRLFSGPKNRASQGPCPSLFVDLFLSSYSSDEKIFNLQILRQ